jgi:hypothetical protein
MSARSFLSLAILTAIALIAAIGLVVAEQIAASGDQRAGGLMFPEFAERAEDVTRVTIDARLYDMDLQLIDGQWVAIDRADYPVRGEPIDQLLAGLQALVEYEGKTDVPDLFPLLGVADPAPDRDSTRVTVAAADGDVLVDAILGYPANAIGRHTRGGVYVRRIGEERAWLAEGTVIPPTFVSEFFDQLFTVTGPEVGRVTILQGDTVQFDAVKVDFATGDYDLVYLDPAIGPEGATARDSAVRGMSQGIVSMTFVDAIPLEDVTIAADARTIRYVTQDGLSLSVTLAERNDTTYVVFVTGAEPGSPAQERAATIAAATSQWAFELQPGRLVTFRRDIAELFDRPIVPVDEGPAPAPAPEPLAPLPPVPAPP